MNKKIIFTSLSAAAVLASCSDDAIESIEKATPNELAGRAKVNLTIGVGENTRLDGSNISKGIVFDANDKLGATIVDAKTLWTVADGNNVGHNKWTYDPEQSRFVTPSTTAVGSWLFYAQYDTKNTTKRTGVEFVFPQIQEGCKDMSDLAKNDFLISPIVQVDGYESEDMPLNIGMKPANARLILDVKFPAGVTSVNKIVATAQNGGANVDFGKTYRVVNTAIPVANTRKNVWEALDPYTRPAYTTWANGVISAAGATLVDQVLPVVETVNNYATCTDLLAVDCLQHGDGTPFAVEAGKMTTYMLFPAGQYESITLYYFTNKGIYEKVVTNNVQAAYDAAATVADKADVLTTNAVANGQVNLGHKYVNLAKAKATSASAAGSLNVSDLKTEAYVEGKLGGTLVLSTFDLIKVINGISTSGNKDILILSDNNHQKPQITKAVADAIVAKESQVGDIQLTFNGEMDIVGEATAYNLTDVTFLAGAQLISGKVNVGSDVDIDTYPVVAMSSTELNVNTLANTVNKGYTYDNLEAKSNATINLNVAGVVVEKITNQGTVNVQKNAAVTALNNKVNGALNVNAKLETALTNSGTTTVASAGVLEINGVSSSNGTVTNNGKVQLNSTTFDNTGKIVNNGTFISGYAAQDGAVLNNTGVGTIDNFGYLYCYNGNNVINNTAVINAKAESTTYITNNSDPAKSEYAVGTKATTMGVINLDNRDEDISVTTATNRGYIVWTTDATNITKVSGDKFNKVILSANATVNDADVHYVETSGSKLQLAADKNIQELTFKANCTLTTSNYASTTVGYIEVANNVVVKLPTENKIYHKNVLSTYSVGGTLVNSSMTEAARKNKGTILVGGNFYSDMAEPVAGEGIWASGDGNSTAFHWDGMDQ